MSERVSAVVVNYNEPTLERCLQSLSQQTVPLKEIIIADGGSSKEQLEIAQQHGKVIGPIQGIGKARVQAILEAENEYILSCDSDSIYDPSYVEYALENLHEANAVRAGTILPLEWNEWLGLVETTFSLLPPYEFSYAFRRSAFLAAKLHHEDYSHPRADIGWHLAWRLLPRLDPRMKVWTRFPTQGAKTATAYVPAALGALATLAGVTAIPAANEISKLLKGRRITL